MYRLSAGHCPGRVFGPRAPRDAAMRALSPCNCNCLPLLQLGELRHCVHQCAPLYTGCTLVVHKSVPLCDILLQQFATMCMIVHSFVSCPHNGKCEIEGYVHTQCTQYVTLCAHFVHIATLCEIEGFQLTCKQALS